MCLSPRKSDKSFESWMGKRKDRNQRKRMSSLNTKTSNSRGEAVEVVSDGISAGAL